MGDPRCRKDADISPEIDGRNRKRPKNGGQKENETGNRLNHPPQSLRLEERTDPIEKIGRKQRKKGKRGRDEPCPFCKQEYLREKQSQKNNNKQTPEDPVSLCTKPQQRDIRNHNQESDTSKSKHRRPKSIGEDMHSMKQERSGIDKLPCVKDDRLSSSDTDLIRKGRGKSAEGIKSKGEDG